MGRNYDLREGLKLFIHSPPHPPHPHSLTPHTQPAKDHHKLTCYYYTNNQNPRLLLRPAKVEILFLEPRIYMLREVISEPEMARLKELAEPIVRYTDSSKIPL